MASLDREAIYSALFSLLKSKVTLIDPRRWSRRYADYMATSTDQQPSAIMVEVSEAPENRQGLPAKWDLTVMVRVYCRQRNADDRASPGTLLNNIRTQVEKALEWDPKLDVAGGRFIGDQTHTTLGGLCARAWVSSVSFITQGDAGDQPETDLMIEILGASSQP